MIFGIMRVLVSFLVLAGVAMLSSPSDSQSVLESCSDDIGTYCSQVEPRDGRIAACLYAHEDRVSDACDEANGEVSDLIDLFFARLADVHAACSADAVKFCPDTEVGGGRLYSCLRANESKIGQACAEMLKAINIPSDWSAAQ